jgi:hypothetical protein
MVSMLSSEQLTLKMVLVLFSIIDGRHVMFAIYL